MKLLGIIGVLLAAGVAFAGWGYQKHQLERSDLDARLIAGRMPGDVGRASADDASLPAPVARYLRLALGDDSQPPAGVELHQSGELRTDERSERWMRFTAVHLVSPAGCGFVWNASVQLMPFIHLRVLDALVDGRGAGQVILQSFFEVGRDGGTPQMNSGALHRFLAEAVWYPWVLMPSKALRWIAIDEHRSLATLICGGTSVSLEFGFRPDGTVAGIYSPARWGRFGGRYEQVPWEGHFADYTRRDGVLVPSTGEVGWYRDGQLRLVWRGAIAGYRKITDVEPK